jgi:hypothetical protein
MKNRLFLLTFVLSLPLAIFAQDDAVVEEAVWTGTGTLAGMVTDVSSGTALPGANVVVEGTDLGAAADASGSYLIENVPAGSYTVTASVIGYKSSSESVTVGTGTAVVNFSLSASVLQLSGLEVLASRVDPKTAVAFTDVNKEDLELRLGSQDIPLILNTVPSVYSTAAGGGSGDARINVRGFNQNNTAVLLNGVPVNDNENGWVYWSNWDGLADAANSIQLQKGLSAVNLATPSAGGSLNILTDPAGQDRRGSFKQEVGAWGFFKSSLSVHSGLMMDDKLAVSATVVRKIGTGYRLGTWTDASAWYVGGSYSLNDAHRLELYAVGAPQRHGNNYYMQNLATYGKEFVDMANDFDGSYNEAALDKFQHVGQDFNQNAAKISSAAQTILDAGSGQDWQMYSENNGVDRHEKDLLNERENFFHKPQVNLNHYWGINDKMQLNSVFYFSGGMGGGSGTYGDIARVDANGVSDLSPDGYKFYYGPSPWTWDFSGTILANSGNASDVVVFQKDTVSRGNQESIGILRNSNNRQSNYGLISKLNYEVSDNLKAQVGLDLRTAQIYHVKEIRDLLGGNYFVNTDSDFDAAGAQKGLGDAIDYNFTNWVNWTGMFAQGNYTDGKMNAYGMVGFTTVKYTHQNHFRDITARDSVDTDDDGVFDDYVLRYTDSYMESASGTGMDWVTGSGHEGEVLIKAPSITTTQFKGGALYSIGDALSAASALPVVGKLTDDADIWANFGVVDKAPIFDQVIQDWDMKMADDPKNEQFISFEVGLNLRSDDGTMAAKVNYYNTTWNDRISKKYVNNLEGDDIIIYLTGLDQSHSGVEAELAYQVTPMIRLDLGMSKGNWLYTDDAEGTYRDGGEDQSFAYALKDLRIGDQPQTTLIAGITVMPQEGAQVQFLMRNYRSHWSSWSPESYEYTPGESAFRGSPWQVPDHSILDVHASYPLPVELPSGSIKMFLHVFNALDAKYVTDALNNSKYNSWDQSGGADDAEVHVGIPMSFNVGLQYSF